MKLWKKILDKLKAGQKVYLLTTIDHRGSSPGRKGFKMMVAEDECIYGSIGGGVMEFNLVEEAKRALEKENPPIRFKKQIHRRGKRDRSGMICSGEQTLVFHPLGKEHLNILEVMVGDLQNGNAGKLSLSHHGFSYDPNGNTTKKECEIASSHHWHYTEWIGRKRTLYIVGGGHVGLAVSDIFSKLGYYVIVLDDRDEVNTFVENDFADQKVFVDYQDIVKHIPKRDDSYIAVMTNKFTDDAMVLRQLLHNGYRQLGVLGSTAKIAVLKDALLKEGFTEQELQQVNMPIGISIHSQTPYEIAISIAAEIIGSSNRK